MLNRYNCVDALCRAGIAHTDAIVLRRISMTLHRWHELECGDGNDYASWCIVRGWYDRKACIFNYFDEGKPYLERHAHSETKARNERIADRERGALKRLAAIMARYPGYQAYVQGDPRGCALYILRPGDVREGATVDSCYSNGVAVCK